jgi:hypothetical protein
MMEYVWIKVIERSLPYDVKPKMKKKDKIKWFKLARGAKAKMASKLA